MAHKLVIYDKNNNKIERRYKVKIKKGYYNDFDVEAYFPDGRWFCYIPISTVEYDNFKKKRSVMIP